MYQKHILIILSTLLLVGCSTGNEISRMYIIYAGNYTTTYIKRGKVEGVYFSSEYPFFTESGLQNSFTSSLNEIEEAERILHRDLKKSYVRTHTIYDCGPNIYHNLSKYKRQYFGYTDNLGHKIMQINCRWNKRNIYDFVDQVFYREPADTAWKVIERGVPIGGCSYYWEIKVDITQKKLFDLRVGGRDIASL